MILDAHQHFWKLSRGDYGFPRKDDPLLYRDFLPNDLEAPLRAASVDAIVAVQATETVAETEFLLGLARHTPFIAGVVGWCDLRDGLASADLLDRLAAQGPLVGIRPMLQGHNDVSWLLGEGARQKLEAMVSMGLAFDALVDSRHLAVIDALAQKLPKLHIIVNHLAKPWRDPSTFSGWQDGMQRLARHSNCWVKLSGLPAERADMEPEMSPQALIEFALDAFGVEKLIWGSDWPVSKRQGSYLDSLNSVRSRVPTKARDRIFAENAKQAYKRLP